MAETATPAALLCRLSNSELDELAEVLCSPRGGDPAVQHLRKQLARSLPRKIRKRLEQLDVPAWSNETWERYREAEMFRADCVGLLMCRDPKLSLIQLIKRFDLPAEKLASSPRLANLMRFAVSEEYARLLRELWSRQSPLNP